MIFIGIDPGLTGAVSVIDANGVRAIFDLPTMQVPGAGPKALVQKKIDGRVLYELLLKHCPAGDAKPIVIIEQVHARGSSNGGAGNSVQTQGSLLRSLGAIETVAECMRWTIRYVPPQTWKRIYNLGKEKADSLSMARKLYPAAMHDLKRVRDHNRAESLLLAHWGKVELS